MKTFNRISMCVILFINFCYISISAQINTLSDIIQTDQDELPIKIVSTELGNIFIGGHGKTDDPGTTKKDVFVMKLDGQTLEQEWIYKYKNKDSTEFLKEMIITPDKEVLILFGQRRSSALADLGTANVRIVKLDKDGIQLWEELFNKSGVETAIGMIPLSDNTYAILDLFKENGEPCLLWVEMDENGNIIKEKCIETAGYNTVSFIKRGPNNEIYLFFAGKIIELDEEGDILNTIEISGNLFSGIITDFVVSEDETFLVCGTRDAEGNPASLKAFLTLINKDGDLVWDKIYGGNHINIFNQVMICPESGDIIAVGLKTPNDFTFSDGYYFFIADSDGNEIYSNSLGTESSSLEEAYCITKTSGGEIIAAGVSWDQENLGDIMLVNATNYNCNPNVTSIENLDSKDQAIEIFPNPSSGNFTIRFKVASLAKRSSFRLFNSLNQEVYQEEMNDSERIIVPTELASGMYFYSIRNEKGQVLQQGQLILVMK